jgi:hypothetical protein
MPSTCVAKALKGDLVTANNVYPAGRAGRDDARPWAGYIKFAQAGTLSALTHSPHSRSSLALIGEAQSD